jgi:hypothetical protein
LEYDVSIFPFIPDEVVPTICVLASTSDLRVVDQMKATFAVFKHHCRPYEFDSFQCVYDTTYSASILGIATFGCFFDPQFNMHLPRVWRVP